MTLRSVLAILGIVFEFINMNSPYRTSIIASLIPA